MTGRALGSTSVADLVLLGDDPTRSATALHRIYAVVLHGRRLERPDLNAQLRAAEMLAANDDGKAKDPDPDVRSNSLATQLQKFVQKPSSSDLHQMIASRSLFKD